MKTLTILPPSDKQKQFLRAKTKHIGFGGARGGGKSWSVRTKAKLLALRYAGIRILIVRRTYPELINNHINILRGELIGIAKYNDKDKVLKFQNGSTINFTYCANDADLDRLQGVEYTAERVSDENHHRLPTRCQQFPEACVLHVQPRRSRSRLHQAYIFRPQI